MGLPGAGTRQLDHTPTCCKQPSKLCGNKEGCSSHEGTSMPMPRKGCNERAVHREGTQPAAVARESRHARSRGVGQEAPDPAVTAASPMPRHGRRRSGDMGARGHMRTRHGQKAASVAGASHLPEVVLAPATTAAAGSLTVSAPPLTVA